MNNPSVTFVAVKWGLKYGPDYVNILHDMVRRNLPANFPFRFLCFTDNAAGLLSHIETRPLPDNLNGWWNKLYLFKPGVLEEGARIFYLDLDTAITGDLRSIATYNGEFAMLRDFLNPRGCNSSIMLWRGGFGAHIWQSFEEAGRPDISGGDQVWIERSQPQKDILQDLFPGAFLSFKAHAQMALPAEAKIVCFHGDPKPPQIRNGWVEHVWRIGAPVSAATSSPQPAAQPIDNIRHSIELPFPWLDKPRMTDFHRQLCIVGGGASAGNFIDELKTRQQEGFSIWALNGAFQNLVHHGIVPDAQIISSANAAHAGQVPDQTGATLYYASQCHPAVFEKATAPAKHVVIWHPLVDGIRNLTGSRDAVFIASGKTTGMKAIGLAQTLGFGRIHLYGYDSSLASPPVQEAANDENQPIEVNIDGLSFASSPRLAQQINDFRMLQDALRNKGITLSVYGEGLLPYVARKLAGFKSF